MKDLFTLVAVATVLVGLSQSPGESQAQVSKNDENAMWETQKLLRDASVRKTAIESSPQAQSADAAVRQTVGPANTDKLYDLSADILGDLVKQSGGDVDAMNERLRDASSNPEGFYNSLSDEQKNAVRNLAGDAPMPTPAKR